MDWIDISRTLSPATAVWPGDQPVEWSWTTRLEEGGSVNLGAFQTSAHAATHVDAPFHVRASGKTTDALDVSVFVGQAEVVGVEDASIIRPRHVASVSTSRVLFQTYASTLPTDTWPETITPIHPDTVSALDKRGVLLVGTDAPSVDPLDSTDLPAHNALIEADIVNLEGLSLAGIEAGQYSLLSLPLKLQGADAAPVRAVLGDAGILQKG